MNQSPEWLEFSGLPALLNAKAHGGWPVFKKLIELDCAANRAPGIVELAPSGLGERTGLDPQLILRILKILRKLKVAEVFIPEHVDEELLFRVRTPLKTPLDRAEFERKMRAAGIPGPYHFRYLDAIAAAGAEVFGGDAPGRGGADDGADRNAAAVPGAAPRDEAGNAELASGAEKEELIQRIVDGYFKSVSLKINSFILDELRLLAARFPASRIESVFTLANRREIHSLAWVARELYRREKAVRRKSQNKPISKK